MMYIMVFDTHIHCAMIKSRKPTYPSPYIVTFFVVRTFKIYSLNNFQI